MNGNDCIRSGRIIGTGVICKHARIQRSDLQTSIDQMRRKALFSFHGLFVKLPHTQTITDALDKFLSSAPAALRCEGKVGPDALVLTRQQLGGVGVQPHLLLLSIESSHVRNIDLLHTCQRDE